MSVIPYLNLRAAVSKCRTMFYLPELSLDCNHFTSPWSYSRVNWPSVTSSPSGTLLNLNLSKLIYLHLSILNCIGIYIYRNKGFKDHKSNLLTRICEENKSKHSSFVFCFLHNLLPTQNILAKVLGAQQFSEMCSMCSLNVIGDKLHTFIQCPFNRGVGHWLIERLQSVYPGLGNRQLVNLDFQSDAGSNVLAATWFASHFIWTVCLQNREIDAKAVRAKLESKGAWTPLPSLNLI